MQKTYAKTFQVLDKTLKGIHGVQLDNRKVLCAPGPRTKYFEVFFCPSINYNIYSANKIEYLEAFSNCHKLKELYLRRNNITDIRELEHLKSLKKLR